MNFKTGSTVHVYINTKQSKCNINFSTLQVTKNLNLCYSSVYVYIITNVKCTSYTIAWVNFVMPILPQ